MSVRLAVFSALAAASLTSVSPAAFAQQAPGAAPNTSIRWEKTYTVVKPGKWTGPRLSDGQPDVQGHWSNTIANHNNLTDPQGGEPGSTPRTKREERAPSRITDPADGKVPFQPWAREVHKDLAEGFHNPTKPEYIEPLARCAPAGVPKSFMWHGYEIRQYPNYVVFLFNSGTRVIHLDGKPHLSSNIKLWNADSRGRWEGNTLIVDVTNNNAKARFGRTAEFASENVHIEERYTFDNDGQHYTYTAKITDPTVYTRPWTITIPARRRNVNEPDDGWHYEAQLANAPGKAPIAERYERVCVENNGPFGQLSVTPSK